MQHWMRILWVSWLCVTSAYAASSSTAEAYQQYQRQQLQAFDQYVTSQEAAFKLYKQVYADAFSKYKLEILKQWPQALVSTPKRWVAYSDHYKQRTVIDFEKGQVLIEQKVAGKQKADHIVQLKQQLKRKLAALKKLDYASAFKKDRPNVVVEQSIQKHIPPNWRMRANLPHQRVPILASDIKMSAVQVYYDPAHKVVRLRYKMSLKDASERVKKVLPYVMKQAKQHKIDPALLLAVIQNESSFNPLATSPIPAYGLMQIVPASAGKDATRYLFGRPMVLAPSYLYTPGKNVQTGAAYLHILNYRYLKWIKDPVSRRYCMIAAYNTGAGNVAKSFIGSTNIRRAAEKINRMTPHQVYQYLIHHLPYDETRRYLRKVEGSYQAYRQKLTAS